ncbi:hypothetical protein VM1G_09754 [Cytospora mali]|uniref:Uncharacterized protein n=1 Tax=Cytospora mali TaxID=578113 RepID=A0A194WDP6_CYTMA|nr:hypothetical protein VM1G_09754 [Valsa mali]
MSAPRVEKEGFSYFGDSFYREASNSSSHRRATLPELKAHFSGKDTEKRPGPWYEAQLLHYGLPPSKVKGTAHKRLFDAVMGKGSLTVPAHIQKIEADLKKEWNKKEREAKKATKASSGTAAAPAKGTKRKAEEAPTNVSVNVSVQISSTGAVTVGAAQPAAKKTKTGGPASSATAAKKITTAASKVKKTGGPASSTTTSKKTTTTKAQKVDGDGKSAPSPKPAKPAAKAKAPAKLAARRPAAASSSNGTGVSGLTFAASLDVYDDDGTPPYSEFNLPRSLGILNGRYRVSCPYLEDNFPEGSNNCGLIATLDGRNLWLSFDFNAVNGLMKVDRPYEADEDGTTAFWRGYGLDRDFKRKFINIDTIYQAGPLNRLRFLGDGHIEGTISYDGHEIDFDAYRLSGQSNTSEVTPTQARVKWAEMDPNMDTSW